MSPRSVAATAGPLFPAPRWKWGVSAGVGLCLLVMFAVEAGNPSPFPVATILAGLLVFAGLCAVNLEIAFAVILALTPFSVEMRLPGAGAALQVPTEPMLLVALGAWIFRFLLRRSTTFAQPRLTGSLLLGLGTIAISQVVGGPSLFALKATLVAVWYALYGVFLLNNLDRDDRLRTLLWVWIVPGLLITLASLFMVATGNFSRRTGFWWAYGNFTEHGTFAAYLSFVLAIAGAFTLESGGLARVGWGVLASLVGIQVVLSMTRGAWMGMLGLAALLGLVYWRRLFRPGQVLFLLSAVVVSLAVLEVSGALRALSIYTHTTSQVGYTSNLERVNRWYAGWKMFRTHPLTGVGFGTYLTHYRDYRRVPLGTDQSAITMGVHSEYLKVLAETGLLGAASAGLVLLCVALLAWHAIRGSQPGLRRGLAVGSAGGLLTYLIHGVVNNYLLYDKGSVPVWTCIGTLGAIVTLNSREAAGPPTPGRRDDALPAPGAADR